MEKGLHKFFKAIFYELNNAFSTLEESVSEVLHLISEPSNFEEVDILPSYVKKGWLKATLKEIKISISNHTFIMDEP